MLCKKIITLNIKIKKYGIIIMEEQKSLNYLTSIEFKQKELEKRKYYKTNCNTF